MARKTLLTESEIRQFMKLANIKPLQEMGGSYGMYEDDEDPMDDDSKDPPAMRGMKTMEEEEDPMDDMPAPDGGEEMGEEPAGDMEVDMDADDDMGDMAAEGGEDKEELVAQVVELIAQLAGVEADVEIGAEEMEMDDKEMEMGGDAMDDEGGELKGPMDAPEGDDEDPMMELADDELNEDDIVQEVARRVAARLIREKKQDDMANKLAERIFRRLASK